MNKIEQQQDLPVFAYGIAFIFIITMVAVAYVMDDHEIILPEIAAMAVALWVYRDKGWLSQPDKIFIVPSLTALFGFAINFMQISYLFKLILVLVAMLLLMRIMKYVFPPALATGFLPIVANAHDWSFMISILVTTFVLMLGVLLFKLNRAIQPQQNVDLRKLTVYAVITLTWFAIAYAFSVEHLALIPPITVVVYESLNMPMYSAKICAKQIAVLSLSISIAVLFSLVIEHWILLAVIYVVAMFILLQLFKMKVPAVYAFPFLIYVFPVDSIIDLPLTAVAVSVFSLGSVYLYQKFCTGNEM